MKKILKVKVLHKFNLFIFAFLSASVSIADLPDQESAAPRSRPAAFQVQADKANTKDGFELSTLGFSYETSRHDIFWPYAGEKDKGFSWWVHYNIYDGLAPGYVWSGNSILGGVDYKHSVRNSTRLGYGVHQVDNESAGADYDQGIAIAEQKSLFFDGIISLTLGYKQDLAYIDLLLPAGITHLLNKTSYSSNILLRLPDYLRTRLSVTRTEYSVSDDINTTDDLDTDRTQYRIESLYGISTGWPWIWIGPFYEQINGSRTVVGYWSPEKFQSYGLKLDAAFPIYGPFSGFVEWQELQLKENDLEWGSGYSRFLGLEIGKRDFLSLRISYYETKTTQQGQEWTQDGWHIGSSATY